MEFEEEFDITIPDEEAEKIQTVGQAIVLHRGTHEVGPSPKDPHAPGRLPLNLKDRTE